MPDTPLASVREANEQYLETVSRFQDTVLDSITSFSAPRSEDFTELYFDFAEKLLANQKAYAARLLKAMQPAS
jgi:hypothetical protein